MLLQETYFIAMATFAACGGSSHSYFIHNVNATKCRSRLRRLYILCPWRRDFILHIVVRQNVAGSACGGTP